MRTENNHRSGERPVFSPAKHSSRVSVTKEQTMIPDNFGCVGNTIKVADGHYLDLVETDPATIDLYSIATGLSQTCRFGGQTPRFYSVAEHSYLAAAMALDDGLNAEVVRAILLHDAAEAYIGDVVKPLKLLLPEYAVIEQRIEAAIGRRFDIDFEEHTVTIKRYDRQMLKAEKMHFWPEDSEKWAGFSDLPERYVKFRFTNPLQARNQFLVLARRLDIQPVEALTNG